MKIIAGASRPQHWRPGAAAIMWWEETKASHVYVRLEVAKDIWAVYHAIGSGTELWHFDYFLKHNIPVYEKEFEITFDQKEELFSTLIPRLKTKYSQKHLLGLFVKRFMQYFFKKIIKNPFKDSQKSEVCVETMCNLMGKARLMKFAEDPEDMGIFEVLQALKEAEGKELVNAC